MSGAVGETVGERWWRRLTRVRARVRMHLTYARGAKDMDGAVPPIIIGGTGGSGTRVIVSLLDAAGVFTGTNLHRSLDSLDFDRFCDEWLYRHLRDDADATAASLSADSGEEADGGAGERDESALERALERAMIGHRSAISARDARWAMKHPRSLLLLPLLDREYPAMRFVHVIRDGRDMCFAPNTRQADTYGSALIAPQGVDEPRESYLMRFWAATNCRAAAFGRERLGQRYVQVRLEDLCSAPETEIARLYSRLGLDSAGVERALPAVRSPATLGRWRTSDPILVGHISEVGREALMAFGYETVPSELADMPASSLARGFSIGDRG